MRKSFLISAIVLVLALAAFAIPAWAGAFEHASAGPARGGTMSDVSPAPSGTLSAAESSAFAAEAKRFVSCMREQGFDLPDPVVSDHAVAVDLDAVDDHEALLRAGERCGGPGPPSG